MAEALDPSRPDHAWFSERNRRDLLLLRPAVEREFDDPDTVMSLLRYLIDGGRLSWMRAPGQAFVGREAGQTPGLACCHRQAG